MRIKYFEPNITITIDDNTNMYISQSGAVRNLRGQILGKGQDELNFYFLASVNFKIVDPLPHLIEYGKIWKLIRKTTAGATLLSLYRQNLSCN